MPGSLADICTCAMQKDLVDFGHDDCTPDVSPTGYDSAPGISVNLECSTPLHLAAAHNHHACVEYLGNKFPQCVDRPDRKGVTPLMLAAQGASHSTICLRSTTLVPPEPRPRSSSSQHEDTSCTTTLLRLGAPVDTADLAGNTALHYASAWGNLKTFRVLILAGASPSAANEAGYTPLDYALTMQAAAYCRTVVSDLRQQQQPPPPPPLQTTEPGEPPRPPHLQERAQSPQLRVSEDDASSVVSEPQSPSSPGPRMRKDSGKTGLGLSRTVVGPGPSRLVIRDDQSLSDDDEMPLTARRISASQNDPVNGNPDYGR